MPREYDGADQPERQAKRLLVLMARHHELLCRMIETRIMKELNTSKDFILDENRTFVDVFAMQEMLRSRIMSWSHVERARNHLALIGFSLVDVDEYSRDISKFLSTSPGSGPTGDHVKMAGLEKLIALQLDNVYHFKAAFPDVFKRAYSEAVSRHGELVSGEEDDFDVTVYTSHHIRRFKRKAKNDDDELSDLGDGTKKVDVLSDVRERW